MYALISASVTTLDSTNERITVFLCNWSISLSIIADQRTSIKKTMTEDTNFIAKQNI